MLNMLKSLRIRGKILVAFSLVSLASTVAFTSYTYFLQRATILDGIDEKLKVAARSVQPLLPDGFHDRALTPGSVSAAEHLATMRLLTDYASAVGVTFVYSFVKVDGKIYFTSTSGTEEQFKSGTTVPFFEPYDDASPALLRMFETGETLRETAQDEYGYFRSVLLTLKSKTGKNTFVVGADMRIDEIQKTLDRTLQRCISIGVLSFAAAFLLSLFLSSRITKPIISLAQHADRLRDNNFVTDEQYESELARMATGSRDEAADLAKSFDQMTKTLAAYIVDLKITTAAKERFESELKIAHDIQMSFLPKIFPPFPQRPEIDLYAMLEPAKEVGGDLYDYCLLDDDHLFFYVGDVSDKGVPAALFMAVTMSLMKRTAQQVGVKPDEILAQVNLDLTAENENLLFVTLFCAILNLRTGEVHYSNAGHNPPILIRTAGGVEWVKMPVGLVLAVMADAKYQTMALTLAEGDTLFLYTDGVTEAMNPDRQLYSDERLLMTTAALHDRSVVDLVKEVMVSIKEHAAGASQSDDITVLALQFKGR
jgi:sigma-B regulation protein RsbU (phosphoserine phosphatase)